MKLSKIKQWEVVIDDTEHDELEMFTHRLRVLGGWIYRTYDSDPDGRFALVFVPRPSKKIGGGK